MKSQSVTALLAVSLGLVTALGLAFAAPGYWVDNEWLRVTGEELRDSQTGRTLVIHAECKRQGSPEYIVQHLDDSGTVIATARTGKYCPREGAQVTFPLPLPATGAFRIEFKQIEGTM